MPPLLALCLWILGTTALLVWDPAQSRRPSAALWIPLIWMFILGTRNPSQWLSSQGGLTTAQSFEEGNPLDRLITMVLLFAGIGVLTSRSFRWDIFFQRNLAFTIYLCFTLLSVLWSDFPLASGRRWFRDFGNYLMILVILSDRYPLEAIRVEFRRLFFLLTPLSVLLVKYFPDIGRTYDAWTGMAQYSGATTGKNLLGLDALLSGIFFFWDTTTRWPNRGQHPNKKIIYVNLVLLGMSLWLLNVADSATCRVCMFLGSMVVLVTQSKSIRRRPTFLKVLLPSIFFLYLILAFGMDMNGQMASSIGKDPTLTDRTKIWAFVLNMHTNPLIGTGYESFWMGKRLELFWDNAGLGHINEAHNGFLEVYLNIGLVGLAFLGVFIFASYRTICKTLKPCSSFASFSLAIWIIMLFYSVTEAGFRSGLIWLVFVITSLSVGERVARRLPIDSFVDGRVRKQIPIADFDLAGK
jgi:exopolysaccharide production protein ExoQ